ncbi:carboxy-terminal-processing protease CtpA [Gottschalkia purinilytica]|uniref:Carboxy-terminal-processing protease CtpA n=1 Tax=Gottschalkia purinilytica TaxID=1503 RepID=A0A0L0WCG9_GOTPU|nr:S41 family peptidase [Gottschalkia purinilytica]KNF09162.1 carboxy-terminal-processing protease CtpA [Gottschalkia purinilytica]
MISKRKATVGAIVLVIITSLSTFAVSNIIQIPMGQKVIVERSQYNDLVRSYNRYSKVSALESFIEDNYLENVKEKDLEDGQLKGLFQSLGDPYSIYMNKEEFQRFMEDTQGVFGGVGLVVTLGKDNNVTVVEPMKGAPGERAGIKKGDKIVRINGKEVKEFKGDKLNEATKLMKGEPGTKVKIKILRQNENGNPEYLDKEITREEVRTETVESKMLENKIGYIRISSFDELTYDDFKKELKSLQKDGMKALVLDIRYNPGGILDISTKIADELMGKGTIVYTETKDKKREYTKSNGKKLDLPLALLVNDHSASASEILAGAIQDTKTGVIIGTKTFGKGIVQRVKKLPDGSGFKLTVSEYFTPKGRSIHKKGVKPDIVVELPKGVEQIGPEKIQDDTQLQKSIEVLKEKLQ